MCAPLRPPQDASPDLLGAAPQHTLATLAAPRRSAILRAVAARSFGASFNLSLLAAIVANLLMLAWLMLSGDYSGLAVLDGLGRGLLVDMFAALCWGVLYGTLSGVLGGLGAALICVVRFWPAAPDRSYRWAVIIPSAIYATFALIAMPWLLLGSPLSLLNMAAIGPFGLRTIAFLLLSTLGVCWIAWRQVGGYFAMMGMPAPSLFPLERWDLLLAELRDPADRAELLRTAGTRHRWRAALMRQIDLRPGMRALDLMCGTGLLWPAILRAIGPSGSLAGLDARHDIQAGAQQRRRRLARTGIRLIESSALATGLPDSSVDAVTCAFGLYAIAAPDQGRLAGEISRVLVPGGIVGVVERTEPPALQRGAMARLYPAGLPSLRQALEAQGFVVTTLALDGGFATLLLAMKAGAP